MIAGNIQIASSAALNITAAAAPSKSPAPAADFQSAFHQYMSNEELGKLTDRPLASARPAVGAQSDKDSTTEKPAKKQTAPSLTAAATVPDKAAALPQLRPLPSFPPPGANAASLSAAAAQPYAAPTQSSEVRLAGETAGQVDSAAHEKLGAPAETPVSSSLASAATVASAGSAKQSAIDDIPRSQPEPPKAAQAGQPLAAAQVIPSDLEKASPSKIGAQAAAASLPPSDHGDKAELDDDPTSAVVAQPSSALPLPQLSAAAEPALPPGVAQNPQAILAELTGGDALAQAVDGVSTVKPAPANENSAPRPDAGAGHDTALDARHGKTAPAASERKTAETIADQVPNAAETAQPRPPAAPAHASDAVSNSSFTQALAAERTRPPANEATSQEAAPSANLATLDHAAGASDEPNASHLQSARLTGNDTQSEMRVNLNTADYGHVEIKTTLQNSALGATIAVEHAALRDQIVSALPELRHSFSERQITLDSLTVNDTLSASTSFTNSHQQRSNQQPADVPYQGSQERPAEPDWEAKSGVLSGPVPQSWGVDSGSKLNVLV
jgi:flagellar hook-length control protein FliK